MQHLWIPPSLSLSVSLLSPSHTTLENVTAQSKLIGGHKFARALPPAWCYSKFVAAGYYTIEQRSKKYRIVFLNTNLWLNPVDSRMLHRAGSTTVDNTQDPFGQWSWFQSVLDNARKKKETVSGSFAMYDVSSILPGKAKRSRATKFSLRTPACR